MRVPIKELRKEIMDLRSEKEKLLMLIYNIHIKAKPVIENLQLSDKLYYNEVVEYVSDVVHHGY